jgi:hypothetical protein
MGRAIVREPAVFLFDEPLSNLDAKLRVQMRLEIRAAAELGVTALYVTHDQVEAMTLADRDGGFPRRRRGRSYGPRRRRPSLRPGVRPAAVVGARRRGGGCLRRAP